MSTSLERSVFILFSMPIFLPNGDRLDRPERQLGVYLDQLKAERERDRLADLSSQEISGVEYVVDEYRIGELYWLSGFFVWEEN